MDVWRFVTVSRVEEEAIRAGSQYCRHRTAPNPGLSRQRPRPPARDCNGETRCDASRASGGSARFRRIVDTSSRCSLCDPFKKRLVHSRLPACASGLEVPKDLCAIPDTDQLLCWCCLRTALTPFAFLCEGGPHSGVPTLLYNYRIGHLDFFCSGKRPIFAGCGGNHSFPLRGISWKLLSRSA